MTGTELIQSLRENAGLITGVSAAMVVLWRYVFNPFRTLISALRKHSEGIAHILPLLSAGRERWPQPLGSGSFLNYIDTLDARVAHNECRTEVILDHSPQPIYECSTDGMCAFANEKLCDLFGISEKDMLGNGWLEGIMPDERERVHSTWISAVEKQIPYESSYTVRNCKTGEKHRAVTRALPLYHGDEIVGYLGVFTEINKIEE